MIQKAAPPAGAPCDAAGITLLQHGASGQGRQGSRQAASPLLLFRKWRLTFAHPTAHVLLPAGSPEVNLPAMVPVLHGTPGSTRWAGPELGEHTEQVLKEELGMDDAEIARLRECGAI